MQKVVFLNGASSFILSVFMLMFPIQALSQISSKNTETDNTSFPSALQTVKRILNDHNVKVWDEASKKYIKYDNAVVRVDKIEIVTRSGKKEYYFSKMFGGPSSPVSITHQILNDNRPWNGEITYTNGIEFVQKYNGPTKAWASYKCLKDLYDALVVIQGAEISIRANKQKRLIAHRNDSLLVAFKPLAEKYRALKTKPSQTEEQRKYVVQGVFLDGRRQYTEAIKYYQKAISLDSTAFPLAYYDLAVAYDHANNYQNAIFYMKEYLMLVPKAPNARNAQDKIYQWDLLVNPPK